jgi:uncharacterized damage-inducible protein DinB
VKHETESLITTLAWYNRLANDVMAVLLLEHPAIISEPDTTYFGSVLALLNHITLSDIVWLRRFSAGIERDRSLHIEFRGPRDTVFSTFERWREHRGRLDRYIESFCARCTGATLSDEITYRNSAGTEYRHPLWQPLLHMFNHETHHRGQVAQVLDDRGIENDFSNLIWYIRE